MNKHLLVSAMALALTACGSTAIMDKSPAVKAQPEINIKTDNNLWKLGREGTFDIAGMYKGKYSRSASSSTWFNKLSFKDGEMAAEVTRKSDGKTWVLTCTGGGVSYNYMGVEFGGNDPYTCDISSDEKSVGEYKIEPDAGVLDIGFDKTEKGLVRIGDTHFNVKTIHTGEGLLVPVDTPLGYSFERGTQEVAAVQTNGALTIQMLDSLNDDERDTLVVGAIASALGWRPQE